MIVAYWVRGAEFEELARLSAESVLRIYPGAEVRYVSDDGSRPAMVANLDAQIGVLSTAKPHERVLFLDADTLMQKQFPWGMADLAVTWRDHVNGDREMAKFQPYNYGVIGVRSSPVMLEAFIWLRARILQMTPKNQAWYGNQLALAELVGMPREHKSVNVRWSLADRGTPISVHCLPCEIWNYSPAAEGEDVSEKGLIHLKGNRKDMMQHYAARLAA